eukprot:CAMPEP_0170262662 /NCGR_PEP_ID=MMETSP0116_2-20130129/31215_1 /TAXON_ID=400756 /ORGANISM="Durinskia baltica, Strain CSIRO CS-38" /LENGTH=200 /DNA_ID=CAMNT_0010513733 /DNA_START=17 /DNA_END=619 /DNA_ORIENTATION=+
MIEIAALLLCKLGGKDGSAADIKAVLEAAGVEGNDDAISKLTGDLDGKDVNELLAAGMAKLKDVPMGGGGGNYTFRYKMDKLTKAQKDELATSFAVLALYDGGAEISSGQISALLEATGNTEVEAFYPIIFANFLSNPDKVATLIASPGAGSGGGGGGGGAAAGAAAAEEAKEEEKEEEEEADIGGGVDMFGGGGGGGDY